MGKAIRKRFTTNDSSPRELLLTSIFFLQTRYPGLSDLPIAYEITMLHGGNIYTGQMNTLYSRLIFILENR